MSYPDVDKHLERIERLESELAEARAQATRFGEQLEQALKPSIDGPGRYIHDSEHKAIVERLQSEVDRLTAQDRAHAGRVVDLMQEIEQFGRASEMYLFSANALRDEIAAVRADRDRLDKLVNSPEMDDFLKGVRLEAAHQRERFGQEHDEAKRPADWFWLVAYLAGKALHSVAPMKSADGSVPPPNDEKALHHCISTAAALFNWHSAIKGTDTSMCPGRSDLAVIVESTPSGGEPVFAERYAQGTAAPVKRHDEDDGPTFAHNHQ